MAMKMVYHCSRKDGHAGHNDRSLKEDKDHINPALSHLNQYLCVYQGMSFPEAERKFYAANFSEYLQARNESCIAGRHPERTRTIDDLLKGKNTRPEEVIIQIGDRNEHPDAEELMAVFNELNNYSQKLVGRHCKVLDVALHLDEETPHIHIRKVWVYRDPKDKILKIGQNKALERTDIPLPEPDRAESRTNNRKASYDLMMRQKMREICLAHGLDIDLSEPGHRRHMSQVKYKIYAAEKELDTLSREKDAYPLDIQERAELARLRALEKKLAREHPDIIEQERNSQEQERKMDRRA